MRHCFAFDYSLANNVKVKVSLLVLPFSSANLLIQGFYEHTFDYEQEYNNRM